MNIPLITLIAPVYKVEPYLREALDSAVNQTYQNLEIILVDDGSPDNCGQICDEYAAKDSRIKVIHKENGGAGSARNAGIDAATGEYVAFFDSDDTFSENYVEVLYDSLTTHHVDFAMCGMDSAPNTRHTEVKSRMEMLQFLVKTTLWGPVCKIFSHDKINALRFPKLAIAEDALFVFQYLQTCDQCVYADYALYNYRLNPQSAMQRSFYPQKADALEAWRIIIEQFTDADEHMHRQLMFNYVTRLMGITVAIQKSKMHYSTPRYYLSSLKWIRAQKLSGTDLGITHLPRSEQLKYWGLLHLQLGLLYVFFRTINLWGKIMNKLSTLFNKKTLICVSLLFII